MPVRILVPLFYRSESDDAEILADNCGTIADCLDHLVTRYPDIRRVLFDKKGRLQNWVGVYLNGQDAYPNEISRPVKDGDEVRLFLYLSV